MEFKLCLNDVLISLDTAEAVRPAFRPEMMILLAATVRPVKEGVRNRLDTDERQVQPAKEAGLPRVPPLVAMQIIHIF